MSKIGKRPRQKVPPTIVVVRAAIDAESELSHSRGRNTLQRRRINGYTCLEQWKAVTYSAGVGVADETAVAAAIQAGVGARVGAEVAIAPSL